MCSASPQVSFNYGNYGSRSHIYTNHFVRVLLLSQELIHIDGTGVRPATIENKLLEIAGIALKPVLRDTMDRFKEVLLQYFAVS